MQTSAAFPLYFARLLAQVVREPGNLEAQRATARDLVAANGTASAIVWDNWQIRSAGAVIDASIPGVLDLLSRMAAHGVRELAFDAGTDRSIILGVIGILAQDPELGDGGANFVARLAMLGADGVRVDPVVEPRHRE